jgi:hypothetical protein
MFTAAVSNSLSVGHSTSKQYVNRDRTIQTAVTGHIYNTAVSTNAFS